MNKSTAVGFSRSPLFTPFPVFLRCFSIESAPPAVCLHQPITSHSSSCGPMKRVPAFEREFTFRSWTLPSWLMTLNNNHLHPSDKRCVFVTLTLTSQHPWWKIDFCHTVFQSANPPFTKRRRVQQAEHGVIPLWTRRLPPVHNPPPTPAAADLQSARAASFSLFSFSFFLFRPAWFLCQKQMASRESFQFNKSTSGFQPRRFGCYSANCCRSELGCFWLPQNLGFQRWRSKLRLIIIVIKPRYSRLRKAQWKEKHPTCVTL